MTARPYVPNVLKVEFEGTVGPFNFAIILHAGWSGTTPTAAALNALAADIVAGWTTGMKPLLAASTILGSVVLTDLSSASGAQGINTVNQAGTGTGGSATGNACVLVTYPSALRYRGGHPRSYLPPPLTGILADDAHITNAGATAWATGWGDVLTTLYGSTSGGTTLSGQCAVSYVTAKTERTTPVVMAIASGSASVKTQLASQRRRIGRK